MRIAPLLLGLLAAGAHAAEAPLAPADFAYGMGLETVPGVAVFELTLPVEVYRAATRPDLGDLRVFNAAGEVVPHALRPLAPVAPTAARVTPALFPLRTRAGETAAGTRWQVRRDAAGRITAVESEARPGGGARRVGGYLLDFGAEAPVLRALELDWQGVPAEFIGHVSVEASDDLEHWRVVARAASVAELAHAGQRLSRRRVELGAQRARYLRLGWPAGQETPPLRSVQAEAATEVPVVRHWVALEPLAAGDRPGELAFRAPGRLPAERARLVLRETNSLARVEVLSRERPDEPWRLRGRGEAYRLRIDGQLLEGPELALGGGRADRDWLVRVTPPDALGRAAPGLELGWTPQRLVFVARGAPPFALAYGAAAAGPAGFELAALLRDLDGRRDPAAAPATAGTGPQTVLGGEGRLRPGLAAGWRSWLLWAVLLAGVGLLAWMAARLFRQLGTPPAGGPGSG